MIPFVGREAELRLLSETYNSRQSSCLFVIKGRRRIGKSRLIREFARGKKFVEFTGLAPAVGISDSDQREEFSRQLSSQLGGPVRTFGDWTEAFNYLAKKVSRSKIVILLDEISWIASKDKTFISKLKNFWDSEGIKNSKICLIISGSVSTWIEKNIINSTALFGRINLSINLGELSLLESSKLLQKVGFKGSGYEQLLLLSLIGGVPWYIEQINRNQSAQANIQRLFFNKNGLLFQEFDKLFNDLFDKRSVIYQRLVAHLANHGIVSLSNLRTALGYPTGGVLSEYLDNLCHSGFVKKHLTWDFKSRTINRQILFRLSDSYLRFYLKYLVSIKEKILSSSQPFDIGRWQSQIGLQFENLLLNNEQLIVDNLGLSPQEIVNRGYYYQKPTSSHAGCQIDFLIQTSTRNLYICEFKFRNRLIGSEVIEEVEQKIEALRVPKGFATVPVLVANSEVSDSLINSSYFHRIINVEDWLS